MKTAGFVLTGGKSSRMGRDKALLPDGDRPLVEAIAGIIEKATDAVFLVGRPERYREIPYECLADPRQGFGPLSGLEAALASQRAELNFVAACDLAGLQARWIADLLSAMQPAVLCAAAIDSNGKLQPLCAVYRSGCLPLVKRAIDEGRLRALDLLAELNAVPVPVDGVIVNLNTPREFDEWKAHRARIE